MLVRTLHLVGAWVSMTMSLYRTRWESCKKRIAKHCKVVPNTTARGCAFSKFLLYSLFAVVTVPCRELHCSGTYCHQAMTAEEVQEEILTEEGGGIDLEALSVWWQQREAEKWSSTMSYFVLFLCVAHSPPAPLPRTHKRPSSKARLCNNTTVRRLYPTLSKMAFGDSSAPLLTGSCIPIYIITITSTSEPACGCSAST